MRFTKKFSEVSPPRLGILLAVLTLSHTVASFCNLSIPPLTPFLRDELHLTHAEVGMLMSFYYIGVVAASLLFGWASDFLGERWALILGLGIQGIFMIGFAWVGTFLLGGILLLFSGIGYSSVNPATTKGVMRWFPPQGRATAMGIKQTGIPLGGILVAFALPPLASSFGWAHFHHPGGSDNLHFHTGHQNRHPAGPCFTQRAVLDALGRTSGNPFQSERCGPFHHGVKEAPSCPSPSGRRRLRSQVCAGSLSSFGICPTLVRMSRQRGSRKGTQSDGVISSHLDGRPTILISLKSQSQEESGGANPMERFIDPFWAQ